MEQKPNHLFIGECGLRIDDWNGDRRLVVKNPSAYEEDMRLRIQFLGREDPLEEGMATPTPVFLPGESPGQRSQRATVHRVTKNWIRLK